MQRKVISLPVIIVCIIAVLSCIFVWLFNENNAEKGKNAVVYVGGEIVKVLPLENDSTFTLPKTDMTIKVESSQAYISESSCKCKTCIGFGKLTKAGQSAVCLPNRVTVTIEGEGDVDAIL